MVGVLDERQVAVALKREFGCVVSAWYGQATGNWWALVRVHWGSRLVEASTPRQLREAVVRADVWPWPPAGRRVS
ncbi:hypothetical protein AB0L06_13735 [Spirillospora sp. NPDC052269]